MTSDTGRAALAYMIEMMGVTELEATEDQGHNQTLRHLAQFGRRAFEAGAASSLRELDHALVTWRDAYDGSEGPWNGGIRKGLSIVRQWVHAKLGIPKPVLNAPEVAGASQGTRACPSSNCVTEHGPHAAHPNGPHPGEAAQETRPGAFEHALAAARESLKHQAPPTRLVREGGRSYAEEIPPTQTVERGPDRLFPAGMPRMMACSKCGAWASCAGVPGVCLKCSDAEKAERGPDRAGANARERAHAALGWDAWDCTDDEHGEDCTDDEEGEDTARVCSAVTKLIEAADAREAEMRGRLKQWDIDACEASGAIEALEVNKKYLEGELLRERQNTGSVMERAKTAEAERDALRAELAAAKDRETALRNELHSRLIPNEAVRGLLADRDKALASATALYAETKGRLEAVEEHARNAAATVLVERERAQAAEKETSEVRHAYAKLCRYSDDREAERDEARAALASRNPDVRDALLLAALERIVANPVLSVGGGECRPDCNHVDHVAARALADYRAARGGGR